MRHTTLRVAEILNPNRERAAKQTWKPALSLIAVLAVGSSVVASREPQLISFNDTSSQLTSRVPHPTRLSLGGNPTYAQSAVDSSINSSLKAINASYIAPQTQKAKQTCPLPRRLAPQQKDLNAAAPVIHHTNPQPANIIPAKFNQDQLAQSDLASATIFSFVIENEVIDNADPAAAQTSSLVHPANLTTDSVVTTETIFVITQDPAAATTGQPMFQIHFWRVTVFHPVTTSKPIPNKET